MHTIQNLPPSPPPALLTARTYPPILGACVSTVRLAATTGGVAQRSALEGRVDELLVNHSLDSVLQGQDVGEHLEGPDYRGQLDEQTAEQEGVEPGAHIAQHADKGIFEGHGEDLRDGLEAEHVGGVDEQQRSEAVGIVVEHPVRRDSQGRNPEKEHEWDRQQGVREEVRDGADHAILHLTLDRVELDVIRVDGDDAQAGRHAQNKHVEEHTGEYLVLCALPRLDVDDGEEDCAEEEGHGAPRVQHRITYRKQCVSTEHGRDLHPQPDRVV
mmetsp:Transcript_25616/g.56692  ORF Transcript_25616/g.56692 Transcript_25616/m.56692 type:complete len:271 (-) Transcript_25616:76-888(-)